jgi:hypothetical protein
VGCRPRRGRVRTRRRWAHPVPSAHGQHLARRRGRSTSKCSLRERERPGRPEQPAPFSTAAGRTSQRHSTPGTGNVAACSPRRERMKLQDFKPSFEHGDPVEVECIAPGFYALMIPEGPHSTRSEYPSAGARRCGSTTWLRRRASTPRCTGSCGGGSRRICGAPRSRALARGGRPSGLGESARSRPSSMIRSTPSMRIPNPASTRPNGGSE